MVIRRFISSPSRSFATLLVTAAIATSAHTALAAPGPASARPPRPAAAGMLIGIDPVSGALGMPDAAQRARLEAHVPKLASLTAARPAPVYHANGSVSMNVRSWMREFSIARTAPGSRPALGCVDGESAAMHALRHAPQPPPTRNQEER